MLVTCDCLKRLESDVLLLTDYKSDLIDYFDEEKEVYLYKNIQELNEKIVFLCNNPEKEMN